MLPNWSLHLTETHGVTMDRVLRTQNICHFLALGETKLFSFVNVNSKNHIFVHALRWPLILLICLVLLWLWNSGHLLVLYLLFQMRWMSEGSPHFYFHRHTSTVFPACNTLLFQVSSQSNRILNLSSGIMPHMKASSLMPLNIDQHWHGLFLPL